ncbi:hypothetical protein ACG9XS_15945 [Acinetobacter gyllenbergii]|uniref:hypothetical protein n=1 Tax=Acinetobacter gyllenbergii TaxID=134534 RepID=UPI003AF7BFA8
MTRLFQKGDLVYCPEIGEEVYPVEHYTSPKSNLCVIGCEGDLCVFYPTGYADPNRLCVWHATEENRKALSILFPEHSFSLPSSVVNKHGRFSKDLNKLISGDYVLVPTQPTKEMEQAGIGIVGFKARQAYKAMIAAAQGVTK